MNTTDSPVEPGGWALIDAAGTRNTLTGTLAGGSVMQLTLDQGLLLSNKGDSLLLVDATGGSIDHVTYDGRKVRPGRTICFGR